MHQIVAVLIDDVELAVAIDRVANPRDRGPQIDIDDQHAEHLAVFALQRCGGADDRNGKRLQPVIGSVDLDLGDVHGIGRRGHAFQVADAVAASSQLGRRHDADRAPRTETIDPDLLLAIIGGANDADQRVIRFGGQLGGELVFDLAAQLGGDHRVVVGSGQQLAEAADFGGGLQAERLGTQSFQRGVEHHRGDARMGLEPVQDPRQQQRHDVVVRQGGQHTRGQQHQHNHRQRHTGG